MAIFFTRTPAPRHRNVSPAQNCCTRGNSTPVDASLTAADAQSSMDARRIVGDGRVAGAACVVCCTGHSTFQAMVRGCRVNDILDETAWTCHSTVRFNLERSHEVSECMRWAEAPKQLKSALRQPKPQLASSCARFETIVYTFFTLCDSELRAFVLGHNWI